MGVGKSNTLDRIAASLGELEQVSVNFDNALDVHFGGVLLAISDPHLHRFTIIFDREGYSPDFFSRMKEKKIACVTYHKFPKEDWPEEEFQTQKVSLKSGSLIEMNLAERGVRLSNGLWVREVRILSKNRHQTAIIATDYKS